MKVVYLFTRSAWQPAVDIYRTDEGLLLVIEAYGCEPRDLHIVVERQRVTISGHREPPVPAARWLQGEIAWGAFERVVPLPEPVDPEGARAETWHGLLLLRCPVGIRAAHGVRIPVEVLE
jgi:HSP20 family protein